MPSRDPAGHYAALNVSPDASQVEIRLAYNFLRESYKKGNKRKNVGKIRAAYEVLGDPESRKAYDNPVVKPGVLKGADGKSRVDSAPLLATLFLLLIAAVGIAFGPAIRAHFVSFDIGDALYWKQTSKPIGVVLGYEPEHGFEEGPVQAAYKIRSESGETYWLPASDVHRHGGIR